MQLAQACEVAEAFKRRELHACVSQAERVLVPTLDQHWSVWPCGEHEFC